MDQTRREFIRTSLAGLTSFAIGSISVGCAPSLQEVNKGIENVEYESNPILPIPKRGCYTGTNRQWFLGAVNEFKEKYGMIPTFNAPGSGTWWVYNQFFPADMLEHLIKEKVISAVRYVVSPMQRESYKAVIRGDYDDHFKKFGADAAKFGKPLILLPWQCVNEPLWEKQVWSWSRADPSEYKTAWVRMHEIFKQEGANKNVVWSTKMINWGFARDIRARDPFDYIPDSSYVDIIGWNCNAYFPGGAPSFNSMFRSDYLKAYIKYPTKPQVFWELGAHRDGGDQAEWWDSALTSIEEQYPRVKGIMFDVHPSHDYDPRHTDSTLKVILKHFSQGYFIGSSLV